MAMILCKECQQQISDKADRCPHCGAASIKAPGMMGVMRIVLVVAILIGIALVIEAMFKR